MSFGRIAAIWMAGSIGTQWPVVGIICLVGIVDGTSGTMAACVIAIVIIIRIIAVIIGICKYASATLGNPDVATPGVIAPRAVQDARATRALKNQLRMT